MLDKKTFGGVFFLYIVVYNYSYYGKSKVNKNFMKYCHNILFIV